MAENKVRLPRHALPRLYNISLDLDTNKRKFVGKETVDVELIEKTNTISFHAKSLDITSLDFSFGDHTIIPERVKYDSETETMNVLFGEEINPCTFTVKLEFSGKIVENGLYGLYVCVDSSGNETFQTHFQSSFARCVFPCWDEPSFKAAFVISITCDAEFDTTCISNMPVEKEERIENRITRKFMKSPVMSTYLVGLAIGKFDVAAAETPTGVPVRVFTPKGKARFGQYAADTGAAIIPFFEEFFKVPFMLPKMDIVSVPEHAFVAMENWGILMFREANLLVDVTAAESRKVEVVQIVGHELSHQWFGNLVTCDYWSQIWLNEGFAEWTEYLTASNFFPQRKAWFDFLHSELAEALAIDALSTSHPLEVPLNSAAETAEIFDSITYSKGCSLVRMIFHFIGQQNFRDGLSMYLEKFAYKNATTPDLWKAFDSVSGQNISKVMQSYVSVPGFPFLEVSISKKGFPEVRVETFSALGRSTKTAQRDALVCMRVIDPSTGKSEVVSSFSSDGKVEFSNMVVGNRLVIANPGSVWLCRVSYPLSMWRKIGIACAKNQLFSSEERFTLQNDLFALALAQYPGGYSIAKWLAFITQYMNSERSFAVWKDIASTLTYVSALAHECDRSSSYKYFVQTLVSPIFNQIGWDQQPKEASDTAELRAILIQLLGFSDDPAVMAGCQIRFAQHVAGERLIEPELRQAMFSVVAFHGGLKEYEKLFRIFDSSPTDDVRSVVLSAIGCFQEPETRNKVVDWLDQPNLPISVQSLPRVLTGLALSPDGRQLALEFLIRNWSKLILHCAGPSGLLFGRIAHAALDRFLDTSVAELIEIQFDTEPLATAKCSIRQLVESIQIQAEWAEKETPVLKDFFDRFGTPEFCEFSKLFGFYFPEN